ncbi:hypothetical protein R3P38DRAFT_3502056 [Favolaschia claudopus]|uniref:Gamma-tubulin complex component n=1 Tax=Favolaschia claudopus TaxID=2862362 RepID=A0AAV9Z2T8_9AGAR
MVNPYLDWIWSQYSTSPHPEQHMLSLRETCSSFVKLDLQPSDITLSHGGYMLRSDLAAPLSETVAAMDHFLALAAQHLRLVKIPSIGHYEQDILLGKGLLATLSQILVNWVTIIDRIWAAKHQLKAMCAGNVSHASLHSWDSKFGCIASSLPLELRSRLPKDLVDRFSIKLEEHLSASTDSHKTIAPPAVLVISPSANDIGSSFPDASSETLIRDWRLYMSLDFTEIASAYVIRTGVELYILDSVFLHFVMDTVNQVEDLLSGLTPVSAGETLPFQIDPHGELKRRLQQESDLDLLTTAWKALTTRMKHAHLCFKEYQRQRQDRRKLPPKSSSLSLADDWSVSVLTAV